MNTVPENWIPFINVHLDEDNRETQLQRGAMPRILEGAPSDQQAIQTRLAMDLVVRALEGKPHPRYVAPRVVVVDRDSIRTFDASSSLPPRGFRPIFSVDDWQ